MDFLLNTYGAKLEAKWQAGLAGEPGDIKTAIQASQGQEIPEKLIGYVSSFDPSQNGQYTQWLLLRYLKNGVRLEDLPSIREYLNAYSTMKAKKLLPPGQSDINALQDFAGLVQVVKQNRSSQLPNALEKKWKATLATEPEAIQAAVAQEAGKTIGDKILMYLRSADPTTDKRFTYWLGNAWLTNGLKLEDLGAAEEALVMFMEKHDAGEIDVDIDTVESLDALRHLVGPKAGTSVVAATGDEGKMLQQSKVLIDDHRIRILIPQTKAAACYFGRNTEWCTTYGDHLELGLSQQGRNPRRTNNMYDHYTKQGPLFIIELKDHKPFATDKVGEVVYQYHLESGQFADAHDRMLTGDIVKALLTEYPEIMVAIGEDRFAKSHLKTLGLRYFSPEAFADLNYHDLIAAINSKEDFEHLPEPVRHDPAFLARFLWQTSSNRGGTASFIPKEDLTPAVIAEMNEMVPDKGYVPHPETAIPWPAFELFNIKYWSPTVVGMAVETGRLSYEQYMQLPEEDRSDAQLRTLIGVTASKHPENIATYPAGLIGRLHAGQDIVERNARVMEYLGPHDLSEDDLVTLFNEKELHWDGATRNVMCLAYLPPDRLTDKVIDAFNETQHEPNLEHGAAGQEQLRKMWTQSVMSSDGERWRNLPQRGLKEVFEKLPTRYRTDPSFMNTVFRDKVEQLVRSRSGEAYGQRHGRNGMTQYNSGMASNDWMDMWFRALKENNIPITSDMVEEFAAKVKVKDQENGQPDYYIQHKWEPLFLSLKPEWTEKSIKAALTKKIIRPEQVDDAHVTPEIAARMFALDPEGQKAMVYRADDPSLAHEIGENRHRHYGGVWRSLFDFVPQDRITEPVAWTAVSTGYVKDAKKRIPKDALSARVYYTGIGRSFNLKDVPKKWRNDKMEVEAVERSADQIVYIAEPLKWLNDHRASLNPKAQYWSNELERQGYIVDAKGEYHSIRELPHDDLTGGYTLHKIDVKAGKRWYLYKGDRLLCILTINKKTKKLGLSNEHPSQDLKPVFLEIARKYLAEVDTTVLNNMGIYRRRDGDRGFYTQDDDDYRYARDEDKKEIEGFVWTKTAHLQGTMYTAWKDDKAVLSIYKKNYEMYELKVMDHKTAVENSAAILKGIEKELSWGKPGHIEWALKDIGIEWSGTRSWGSAKNGSFWLSRDKKVGKVGKYEVFYAPAYRYITIFDDKGLAAYGTVLKKGDLVKDHISYRISEKDKDAAGVLRKTLDSMAAKVKEQTEAAKKKK